MKTCVTGAATVPQTESEQPLDWIHQLSDLNSDTGVLVMHKDHCDTRGNDSDSSFGSEKPWKQHPLKCAAAFTLRM